ncbi:protein of unknown function [Citrobacter freundii]|nr:protein of unknown function [Citrobacter freundii]
MCLNPTPTIAYPAIPTICDILYDVVIGVLNPNIADSHGSVDPNTSQIKNRINIPSFP